MHDYNKVLKEFWQHFKDEIQDGKQFQPFFKVFTMDVQKYNIVIGSDYFQIRSWYNPVLSYNDIPGASNLISMHHPLSTHSVPYFKSHDDHFNFNIDNDCVLTWESMEIVGRIIEKIIALNIPFQAPQTP